MSSKLRTEPEELIILRTLSKRLALSRDDGQNLSYLEKGYQGEKRFDQLLAKASCDRLVLNDLLLESNNTKFQIDSLIILHNTVHFFEIKNYEGDFYVDNDGWYTMSGKEIKNPLLQVNRSTSLLRQLLQQHALHFHIESHLVFINPAFTLYQAPKDPTIIFPTQLRRFIEKLNTEPSTLGQRQKKLAEKLVSLHIHESFRKYDYDYSELKKGIVCGKCGSFLSILNNHSLICDTCDHVERLETGVKQSIEDFKLLFPDRRITVSGIYEWCGETVSKRTVAKVLSKNYRLVLQGRASYYISIKN